MAKIRNKSGQALFVPSLGREVDADEVAEVPDDDVHGFTSQSIWEPVGKADQALHDKGQRAAKRAAKAEIEASKAEMAVTRDD